MLSSVLNQALRYQFGWSNQILDPLFCEGKRYEGGCLSASWIRAERHFPIIACKLGTTIIVYDSCIYAVAGEKNQRKNIFVDQEFKFNLWL